MIKELNADVAFSKADSPYLSPLAELNEIAILSDLSSLLSSNPSVHGVIVRWSLPYRPIHAHSLEARIRSIRELGLDPVDLPLERERQELLSPHVESCETWYSWRAETADRLLHKIVKTIEASQKSVGFVAALDSGAMRPIERLASLQNWDVILQRYPKAHIWVPVPQGGRFDPKGFQAIRSSLEISNRLGSVSYLLGFEADREVFLGNYGEALSLNPEVVAAWHDKD